MPHPGRSSRSTTVSHDADRDSTKLTMQTRVAVRDKIPHRFQIIPLREMMKLPPHLDQSAGARISKSSQRPNKVSVGAHLVDSGIEKTTRSLGRTSAKLILQSKDTNRKIPEPKLKKTASLEPSAEIVQGPPQLVQEHVLPKISVPSHGYSQSLNQYSFRLKPWKSFTHIKISDVDPGEKQSGSDWDIVSPIAPESGDDYSDYFLRSDQKSADLSKTLNDSYSQSSLTLPTYDSKKRHAIYSHTGIVPLGYADFYPNSGKQLRPLPLDPFFNAGETGSTESLELLSAPSNIPTGLILVPVLPLKLLRNSVVRPKPSSADNAINYSGIVLGLMQELDEAIASWN